MTHTARISLASATAFGVTYLLTPLVRRVAVRCGWVSRPVDDRWGRRVVARLGGAAMFVGVLTAILMWVPREQHIIALLLGIVLVFLLGSVDDMRRIAPYTKLVMQLLIGSAMVVGGIRIEFIAYPWLSVPLSILWFVFVMNAFNLLDNMDGLAAGIGAIAAGFCALHLGLLGMWRLAAVAAVVSAACLGFLRYNFPPAKIFMGDSGSHLLGLSLAAIALMGSWYHSTELLSVLAVPVLILAVPLFDTMFVTLQRLRHRQHPFTGGTDHISHRLVILGLNTRQTVLALYAVSVCLGCLSLVCVGLKPLPVIAVCLAVLTVLLLLGRYLAQVNVYRLEEMPELLSRPASTERPATFVETMLFHKRRLVEILVDFLLVSSTYVMAYLLRFERGLTPHLQQLIFQALPLVLVCKLACFTGCGLYRGIWRYLGLYDIITIFKGVTLGSVTSSVVLLCVYRFEGYSRTVIVIDWLLTFCAVGGSRVAERLLDGWIGSAQEGTPTLIIGAGDAGEQVLRHLKYEARPKRQVVALLDDDVGMHGSRIHGVPVLGSREHLARLLETQDIREVFVAIPDPPGDLLQHVQQCCVSKGVVWRVVTAGVIHLT